MNPLMMSHVTIYIDNYYRTFKIELFNSNLNQVHNDRIYFSKNDSISVIFKLELQISRF